MNSCIICKQIKSPEEFNVEHIIPEALGGTLKTEACCKKCNSKMGSLIDSRLSNSKAMEIIRFLLKIKGKNGVRNPFSELFDSPYPDVKGHLKFNKDGSYEGFEVLPKPIVNTEDHFVIVGDTKSPGKMLQAINKKIKKDNHAEFTINDLKGNTRLLPLGLPQINISVNSEIKYDYAIYLVPAILKITYEASCYLLGQQYESDSTGNEIREVLCAVMEEKADNIGLPTDMTFEDLNWSSPQRYHSINLSAKGDQLICTVNLLNFLKVSVVISEESGKYSLTNVSPIEFTF